MSQQSITYQQVVSTCQSLKQQGQKPSVRTIHQQIGGSFSSITAFLRQWQEQQAKMNADAHNLSSNLKQALFSEFETIQKQTQVRLNQQLQQLCVSNKEAEALLANYEQQLQQKQQEFIQSQEDAQAMRIELEKQNAMLAASNQHSKERITQLESELETLRRTCKRFEIEAAVNLTRYEAAAGIENDAKAQKAAK